MREVRGFQCVGKHAATADSPTATIAGQKRKIFVPTGAQIPQARAGFGFDYDDYEFEDDEDSTMIEEELQHIEEPKIKQHDIQAELAAVTKEFQRLPPADQENRPWHMDDLAWIRRMRLKLVLHGPSNYRPPPSHERFEHRISTASQSSSRGVLTPKGVSKRHLTEEEQQKIDRNGVIPGSDSIGTTVGVPCYDFDEEETPAKTTALNQETATAVSTAPAPSTPMSTAGANAAQTVNVTAGAVTPATTRRAMHEQYKPRQPSRLREETTVQETSDSEAENQPITPTEALIDAPPADWLLFQKMLSRQPGPRLDVSPEFAAWSQQPDWNDGMAEWVSRLDLPMSRHFNAS